MRGVEDKEGAAFIIGGLLHIGSKGLASIMASNGGLGLVFQADCGYQIFPADPSRVRFADGSFIARETV